jgi:cyclopropane fatty-acyl-phospholipid synthase-like methyltransferase
VSLRRISSNQRIQDIGSRIVSTARNLGLIPHFPIIKDRAIEYGFVSRELDLQVGGKILDVGFHESTLPYILVGLGHDVYGVDIRPSPIEYPGFKTSVQDIRHTNFPDQFFDRIIAVSTIEHLGLPNRYDSYEDIHADRKAIKEMSRILKDDGKMLITIPFGKAAINSMQRFYDDKKLEELFKGFKIIKKEYAKQFSNYWAESTHDDVKDTVGYHANVLLSVTK